ncbi:MAG TPA: diaminopimelate epimerase [Chloroflexota bacterium]|nr:diaminopimelate epimerase [Chloroflexota bacterium]
MDFVKMHGLGNDFIVVDLLARGQERPDSEWAALAVRLCDRHFGVGADGVLLALPSEAADVRMRIFNSDGSEAEMCGNGIRCLARYARDRGLGGDRLRVETLAGVLELTFADAGRAVRVDMGPPRLAAREIPVALDGERVIDQPIEVDGYRWRFTAVSMGNPHAVVFLAPEELAALPLERIGPQVEHHPLFPARTNFHAVAVTSPHSATVRVWERGAGPTLACGTGACAVTVAGVLKGLLESPVDVTLPGGTLRIAWEPDGHVYMTGPAEYVFRGTWLA